MVFGWLTERRRKRLLEAPFPPAWDAYIDDNVALVRRLDADQRERLRDLVHVFVDEKHWEGLGGLELTDEIEVTIAAQACFLLLGREHALYEDVESILVYPSTMIAPPRERGFFEAGIQVVDEGGTAILGQAHLGGPVILAWDDVLDGARGKGKRNVVFHEFAHKIDMADGSVDGTPPLPTEREVTEWTRVWTAAFRDLVARVEHRVPSSIDAYGATNEAEFFAVATETYFLNPFGLRWDYPALYRLLDRYYRPDRLN